MTRTYCLNKGFKPLVYDRNFHHSSRLFISVTVVEEIHLFKLSRIVSVRSMLWVTGLALGLVACAASPAPTAIGPTPTPNGVSVLTSPVKIADFTLTNQSGQPMSLSSFKGKYILMSFGYTHCPDICPVTLAHYRLVKQQLAEQSQQMEFVFISVDGARDTPARLSEYLRLFDPAFIGMTGDEANVRSIIKQYNGDFRLNNEGGRKQNYDVEHTAYSFLMDAGGQWRSTYAYNTPPEIIVADIQRVLKSG
jgi:protein SCO1/2